ATARNIEQNDITSLDELKALPHNVAGYSAQMDELNAELKSYLYANFYRHYRVVRMATKAERVLRDLFEAYVEEPLQLPDSVQEKLRHESAGDGGNLHRIVCDYLAGMTDRYAIQEHKRLYDPEERV
ncbi:MAG: deoxyguanosinetriphosphate triphosphohydrolase, partial [Anaerolineae bacterium]|nr:deoxyguanosinetriphosphate triphosphohydrolase [Anaerolineae bacterium]